jgi:cytochrome b pre-mRNA-processing protein 3
MSVLNWLTGATGVSAQAQALYATIVAVGRRAALFGPGRAPDSFDGRFEVMTLAAALALIRLQADPDQKRLAAAFTDILFRGFDSGFREAGVGDLSVPRKMKKVAQDFYGRLDAYAGALKPDAAPEALAAALARNIWPDGEDRAFSAPLAASVRATLAALTARPAAELSVAEHWPLGRDV